MRQLPEASCSVVSLAVPLSIAPTARGDRAAVLGGDLDAPGPARRRRSDGLPIRKRARAARRASGVPAFRNASAGSSSRQFAGYSPACAMVRVAATAAAQSSNATRRRDLPLRAVLHPHPRLGDDAERALGAEEQPVRGRPGAGSGQPPRLAHPDRGDDPQRFGQVVDVGVEGGEVPAGAGGQPAAEGREPEGLREVPQRQIVRAQLVLDHRSQRAGLDPGGPADPVDLEHRAHARWCPT